jgi:hypothetical protein
MKRETKSGGSGWMLTFGVDSTNVELALSETAARLRDFRRFWREFFGPQWFADILRSFRTQGAPVGGWRALSPRYAAWKRSVVGNKPILQFTGAMMRSFEIGDRNNVFRVTKAYVELGSRMPRVAYHDRGTSRVPRRQILYTAPSRVYKPLLDQFVAEEMAAAGMPNVRLRGRSVA